MYARPSLTPNLSILISWSNVSAVQSIALRLTTDNRHSENRQHNLPSGKLFQKTQFLASNPRGASRSLSILLTDRHPKDFSGNRPPQDQSRFLHLSGRSGNPLTTSRFFLYDSTVVFFFYKTRSLL